MCVQNENLLESFWCIIRAVTHRFMYEGNVAAVEVHDDADRVGITITSSARSGRNEKPAGYVQQRSEQEMAVVASPKDKRIRRNSDVSITSDVSVSFAWPDRERPCRFHISRSMPLCTALQACARSHSDDPVEQLRLRVPSREVDYEESVDSVSES